MSVGDWFTLKPVNFVSNQQYQTDLSNIMTQLTTLEGNVTFLLNTIDKVEQNLTYINNQLQQQQTTITQLNSTINTMNTSLNNILNLYLPIEGFQTINLTLTDYHGNTVIGSLEGGWYRPII
jgi:ACT domain-containing protein